MITNRFQVIQTSRDPSLAISMLLEPDGVSSPPYIEIEFTLVGSQSPNPVTKKVSLINRSAKRTINAFFYIYIYIYIFFFFSIKRARNTKIQMDFV